MTMIDYLADRTLQEAEREQRFEHIQGETIRIENFLVGLRLMSDGMKTDCHVLDVTLNSHHWGRVRYHRATFHIGYR